jgi:hypothetical protein
MNIAPEETSLVIAGAWNAAILTPAWVIKYGLLKDGGTAQVFFPTAPGAIFQAPRFNLGDLSFTVLPNALVLLPSEHKAEHLSFLEEVAARMLSALPHTPVTGVGHNFEYRDHDPSSRYLKVFTDSRQDLADEMPLGWEATAAAVASSFKNASRKALVNIQRQLDGGMITMKFNFHCDVTSVDRAVEVLEGKDGYARMTQNLETAEHLVNTLYGGPQGDQHN